MNKNNNNLLNVFISLVLMLLVSILSLEETKPVMRKPQQKPHQGKLLQFKPQPRQQIHNNEIQDKRKENKCNSMSCIMTLYEWQHTLMPPSEFIVQASSQNGYDDWLPFPVGFAWYFSTKDREDILLKIMQRGTHEQLLFVGIGSVTDTHRNDRRDNRSKGRKATRKKIVKHLQNNGFENRKIGVWEFYLTLAHYKFVASPEGNGIDCHRHYEALVAGCIIIVEHYHQKIMREKYGNVPMLFTENYSEITPQYLNKQYSRMINQTYNFSHLFFTNWTSAQQIEIKKNSVYWQKRACNGQCHAWYPHVNNTNTTDTNRQSVFSNSI